MAAKAAKAKPEAGGGGLQVWLLGMACGGLGAMVPALAAQAVMLLAPGLLALLFDRAPGKPVARTMLLFGLGGSVDPVRAAWGMGFDRAIDGGGLTTAWALAALGFMLTQAIPMVVQTIVDQKSAARAAELRQTRAQLVADWGLEDD